MVPSNLAWQSKLVLLLVLPWTAVSVTIQARLWFSSQPAVAMWALGLSGLLGVLAWTLRTATPAAALTGAIISASLMFSMFDTPFSPLRTGLVPVLSVLVLTSLATRFGRRHKERLGTAEKRHGRGAAQVAANLGMAALVMDPSVQSALIDARAPTAASHSPVPPREFSLREWWREQVALLFIPARIRLPQAGRAVYSGCSSTASWAQP